MSICTKLQDAVHGFITFWVKRFALQIFYLNLFNLWKKGTPQYFHNILLKIE
jgi:hypothetical protein